MKDTSKKSPRKYSWNKLKSDGVEIILDKVVFGDKWREDPENHIHAKYSPKNELKAKCSICNCVKSIHVVEGASYMAKGDVPQSRVFHQSFHLICKPCHTARELA